MRQKGKLTMSCTAWLRFATILHDNEILIARFNGIEPKAAFFASEQGEKLFQISNSDARDLGLY